MDEVFSRYLDPAFRYVWSQNPARVRSRQDALRDGLNCVALAHLVTRDLSGYTLPAWFQSLELARDLTHFEAVPDPERMRVGDLVWFGVDQPRVGLDEFVPQYEDDELVNGRDVPVKHVAICTGSGDSPAAARQFRGRDQRAVATAEIQRLRQMPTDLRDSAATPRAPALTGLVAEAHLRPGVLDWVDEAAWAATRPSGRLRLLLREGLVQGCAKSQPGWIG